MGVHDGGVGRNGLGHRCKIRLGLLVLSLLQKEGQRIGVVGELMGQAALGGVGVHQRFGPLQRCLNVERLLLRHLVVEHLDDAHMDEHCHSQAKRQQKHQEIGGLVLGGDHQHHVQHHRDAGKEGHHQRLWGFQRPLSLPFVGKVGHQNAHDDIRDGHCHKAVHPFPDHQKRGMRRPRSHIPDGIFRQQTHGSVDEGRRQLLGQRAAEQQRGDQHEADIFPDAQQGEETDIELDAKEQLPRHQYSRPEPERPHPAFAEVGVVHHDKGAPLRNADNVADQKPRFRIHR